jgi:hypothetical protein
MGDRSGTRKKRNYVHSESNSKQNTQGDRIRSDVSTEKQQYRHGFDRYNKLPTA